MTKIKGTLHEDHFAFWIKCRSNHIRMRNFWTKVVEKLETHILCSINILFYKNHAVDEITWKKVCTTGHATQGNMGHAHCMLGIWVWRGPSCCVCSTVYCISAVVTQHIKSVALLKLVTF